nr:unnamed protein product [Callosobruchus analis]
METAALVEQGLDNSQPNQEVQQLFNGDGAGVVEKQKEDIMFNFADSYTQNGTDISPTKDMDFYEKEKSNGKRQYDDENDMEDEDDFGPETT